MASQTKSPGVGPPGFISSGLRGWLQRLGSNIQVPPRWPFSIIHEPPPPLGPGLETRSHALNPLFFNRQSCSSYRVLNHSHHSLSDTALSHFCHVSKSTRRRALVDCPRAPPQHQTAHIPAATNCNKRSRTVHPGRVPACSRIISSDDHAIFSACRLLCRRLARFSRYPPFMNGRFTETLAQTFVIQSRLSPKQCQTRIRNELCFGQRCQKLSRYI